MSERTELRGWKEIAKYLGVVQQTARNYEKQYSLPVHRVGGGVIAYIDEVEEWKIKQNAKPASSSPTSHPPKVPFRRKYWYAAVGILGAILLAFLLTKNGHSPVRAALEERTLRAYGEEDEILWEVQLSEHDQRYSTASNSTLVQDIDRDSKNEVCLNYWPKQAKPPGGRLICYDHNAKPLWEYKYAKEVAVKRREFEPRYYGLKLDLYNHANSSYSVLSVSV